ncbi:MAG: YdcF family protein [Bacillus sp. (in: Bacteria)]|nr:YdcF family protein [Bacillus sp. (in: firmicutes)]MCM1425731.1 YdcF family protein [Eubacterium sp.]
MKKEILCVLCSLFCFGYCFLIYSIKSGTRFYLIWGMGGIFFLALTFFLHFHMWAKLPGALQKTILAVLIIGITLFVITEGCIISAYREEGEPNLNYLIVLGAQVKEKGPSAALKFRLDTACDYLMENENTICIVSGGQGANEPHSEAQGMRDYLVEKGIPENRIIMEDKSTDTSENIAFSARFLDMENDRVGIVTNNFHVFRGVHLAKHLGIQNVCGIAAPSNIYFQLNNMVREFFGIMKDLVCGNL